MAGIVVPAGAGAATFTQDAGSITPNPSSGTIMMRSGTFQMNGGKVRGRSIDAGKPSVVVDGGTIVIAATASDSATLGAVANTVTQTTVTGNIPALGALWVAGAVNGQAASVTLTGNPTNAGRIVVVAVLDGASGGHADTRRYGAPHEHRHDRPIAQQRIAGSLSLRARRDEQRHVARDDGLRHVARKSRWHVREQRNDRHGADSRASSSRELSARR